MVIARNSNLLGKITILVMVGLCVNTALALDGSGTQEDPWRIKSLEDFNDFAADANYWDDYTRLETDVNLAGMVYERAVIAPDVNNDGGFQGIPFTGLFDGNDHRVKWLSINGGMEAVGLFGRNVGEVKNLDIEGGSVSGSNSVGGLVGNNLGSIFNCYSTADVNGTNGVGGLMGSNTGTVMDCYSSGSVTGTGHGAGGLVGWNTGGNLSNCHTMGDVNGYYAVGGLAGMNSPGGSISDCYSTSQVNGDTQVGGMVGCNSSSLSNCYSTGDVNGVERVGGLAGYNLGLGTVSNSFWDTNIQTHGVTESIGDNQGTATNVHGLPTSEMQTRSTFTNASWDFINVWNIGENQTYPYLRTVPASDINKDYITNFLDLCIIAEQWMQEQ